MARFADVLIPGDFACGVLYYKDHYPGARQDRRMVISVMLEGQEITRAIVDSGACSTPLSSHG